MASLNALRAEFLTKQGRLAEAKTANDKILSLLSGKNSYTITEQKLQLAAFLQLGDKDKAAALRTKLETRGVVPKH